jgi:type I restriction enzyme S subunit
MDALDDKIELNRKLNETLVQMARAIFKSWFVDFEPFRDKGMVDSPLGRIPKGWDVRQVQTFADVEKGLSYKGQFLAEVGVPMVNLGCLTGHGRFNPAELKHYGGDFKPRHTVRPGDIVIANTDITQKREVLGSPAVVPPLGEAREFVFTHHVFAVRLREEYASWMFYVYYSLLQDEFRERAAGFATGTTVLALPRDAVLDLAIPAPPEQVVQAFSALVVPLVQSGWKNDAESRTLAAIRDALLPKLMSGEVKVA